MDNDDNNNDNNNNNNLFFDQIKDELDNSGIDDDCRIIIGGELNVILDPDLDGFGGKPKLKESVKQIGNICLLCDLVDIWRVRNPANKTIHLETENTDNPKKA